MSHSRTHTMLDCTLLCGLFKSTSSAVPNLTFKIKCFDHHLASYNGIPSTVNCLMGFVQSMVQQYHTIKHNYCSQMHTFKRSSQAGDRTHTEKVVSQANPRTPLLAYACLPNTTHLPLLNLLTTHLLTQVAE
jgi:hypothetical protein